MNEQLDELQEKLSEPEMFGPVFWEFIHLVSLTRAEEFTPEFMDEFLDMIGKLIPCDTCQENFYLKKGKLQYTQEDYLEDYASFKFFHTVHNFVNQALDKKQMSLEKVIEKYQSL